jgi:glyoxylase-like metal-dependent hydrolase (beta-lactamase superfamily II)
MSDLTGFSRRQFLTQASYFGAIYSLASALPFPALASSLRDDPRISQTPIADAGFASVRKIGDGLYATISDPSKGLSTMCNGGFLFGKDAALLVEGFVTSAGAAFQMDTLRKVSQAPVAGALDTHYHYDHSLGNAFYGANAIQLWAHAEVPRRIIESYAAIQAMERSKFLAPFEKRISEAKSEAQTQRAQGDLRMYGNIYDSVRKSPLTLPNRLLDPATLPLNVDLGHFPIVIEDYPGHSGTDLIVRVPEHKVVYAGDLIFSGSYPATFDEKATISGWRTTLKTFASWDKDTIFVPGHGSLCGQQGLQLLRDVFDDLSEQADKMYKAGVPAAEAGDQYVVPEQFKGLTVFSWGLCIRGAITKLYAEWQRK